MATLINKISNLATRVAQEIKTVKQNLLQKQDSLSEALVLSSDKKRVLVGGVADNSITSLQVRGALSAGNILGYDSYTLQVSKTVLSEILFGKTSLNPQYYYRVRMAVLGTAVATGYIGHLVTKDGNWIIYDEASLSYSNNPILIVENNIVKCRTDHANLYTVSVSVERLAQQIGDGFSPMVMGLPAFIKYNGVNLIADKSILVNGKKVVTDDELATRERQEPNWKLFFDGAVSGITGVTLNSTFINRSIIVEWQWYAINNSQSIRTTSFKVSTISTPAVHAVLFAVGPRVVQLDITNSVMRVRGYFSGSTTPDTNTPVHITRIWVDSQLPLTT